MSYNQSYTLKLVLILSISILMMVSAAQAQQSFTQTLDIIKMREAGLVKTYQNELYFNTNGIFDGSIANPCPSWKVDPFIMTLEFKNPQVFVATNQWMEDDGSSTNPCYWTIETANSMNDINNPGSSSYKKVVAKGLSGIEQTFNSPIVAKVIRMAAYEPIGDDVVHINEWTLKVKADINCLNIEPNIPIMLNPGASYTFKATGRDQYNNVYNLSNISWSTNNNSISTVNNGTITGKAAGKATVFVKYGSLTCSKEVNVGADFEQPKAYPLKAKILLIIENPYVPSKGKRLAEACGFPDPIAMANQVRNAIYENSGGVMDYTILQPVILDKNYTLINGKAMSGDELYSKFSQSRSKFDAYFKPLQESGKIQFDLNAFKQDYNICDRRSKDEIKEIWFYSFPWNGLGEGQIIGKTGNEMPWVNGPQHIDDNCSKNIIMMGLDYTQNADVAYHSYCHRAEGIMTHVYGRWDAKSPNLNNWEKFTSINKEVPGKAHQGNCHYPANANADYEYGNGNSVISYTDNWKQYPFLGSKTRSINCNEWQCSQWGYMTWWHSKLPKYAGLDNEGKLNNWWHYIVDIQDARIAESINNNIPTNLQVTKVPNCDDYSFVLSWNGAGDGKTLVISTDPTWKTDLHNKNITGLTSTDETGFTGGLTIKEKTTYYWGIWDGINFIIGPAFNITMCSPTNMQVSAPSCINDTVKFSWWITGNQWQLQLSADPAFISYSSKDVSNMNSVKGLSGFSPSFSLDPSKTYYWRIKTKYTTTYGTSFKGGQVVSSLPYTQNFESSNFVPANWSLYNPDNKVKWQRGEVSNTGGFGKSSFYACIDNGSNDARMGEKDAMYTQVFDLTNVTAGVLKFEIAYKRFNQYYSDTLAVYASSDCGKTRTLLYKKGGNALSTSPGDYVGIFYPKATEWRTETINLSSFAGDPEVTFIFENISGHGQILYIDNISISNGASGIVSGLADNSGKIDILASVFPNPNHGTFTLTINNNDNNAYTLQVFNTIGQQVMSFDFESHENTLNKTIDLSEMNKGIYLMNVYNKTSGKNKLLKIKIE